MEIRDCLSGDLAALEPLYGAAFPDEDLLPLVRALLEEASSFSLVAIVDRKLAGHVAFTYCSLAGRSEIAALLGPLCVTPRLHKRGIASALVHEGLQRTRASSAAMVHVLGDPAFYSRYGFRAELAIVPPYPLPQAWREAWQSLDLKPDQPELVGRLIVPQPWQAPELWAP